MKPDWKDAPDWANYLCNIYNGSWFWEENAPKMYEGHFLVGSIMG